MVPTLGHLPPVADYSIDTVIMQCNVDGRSLSRESLNVAAKVLSYSRLIRDLNELNCLSLSPAQLHERPFHFTYLIFRLPRQPPILHIPEAPPTSIFTCTLTIKPASNLSTESQQSLRKSRGPLTIATATAQWRFWRKLLICHLTPIGVSPFNKT